MIPNLLIDSRVQGDTAIVACRGRIVHGVTACRFRACIGRLLRRCRRVVIDLGAVTDFDARGAGAIAVLIAQARVTDRRLVLAGSSDRVGRILRLTQLHRELHSESLPDAFCATV